MTLDETHTMIKIALKNGPNDDASINALACVLAQFTFDTHRIADALDAIAKEASK